MLESCVASFCLTLPLFAAGFCLAGPGDAPAPYAPEPYAPAGGSPEARLDKPKISPKLFASDKPRNLTGFMDVAAKPEKEKSREHDPRIRFSADSVEGSEQDETINASGNVLIERQGLSLRADRVTYDRKLDVVTAEGDVAIVEASGDVVFTDKVRLEDKMSKGEMESIKVILRDKSLVWAKGGEMLEGGDKVMREAGYTPCDACADGGDPLWRIRAGEIRHDAEGQNMNYRDVFIDVKGVPVFYTPYLSHSDPTVRRRSGFLAPTMGSSRYLGAAFQPRWFWSISEHEDVTFAPLLSSDRGFIPQATWRKYFYSGEIQADANFMRDDDLQKDRGYLFTKGRYEINEDWLASADLNYVSDKSYLRDLHSPRRNDAWLNSVARVERFAGRDYFAAEAFGYRLISPDFPAATKPYVLPLMTGEFVSDPQAFGSYFQNDLSMASIYRDGEENSQRASMINSWVLPYTSPLGEKIKFQASLKSDVYYVENYRDPASSSGSDYTGAATRVFPQAGVEWKLPLVSSAGGLSQILEPTVVAVAAPETSNKDDRIPNDDSLYRGLDDTNILNLDRYPGFDRNDTGSRVSYGLNWSAYGERTGRTSAFLAQSYNFSGADEFAALSRGETGHFSDYVGRVYAAPNKYFDMNYRFRADKDDFKLKYSELDTSFGTPMLRALVAYIQLPEDLNSVNQGYGERKELFAAVSSQLSRDWSVHLFDRVDLARHGGPLEYGGGLTYEDECLKLTTEIRRTFSADSAYDDGWETGVTFYLKTIGGIGNK